MTRVLHVDTATEWRGGQRQLELLLRARPGDAWAGVPSSPLAQRVGSPAVELRPGGNPLNVLALRAAAPAFDLFAAHTPHALGLCLLARAPTVAHRRVDFVPSTLKYRLAERVIAVSGAVRDVLVGVGVPAERIAVVYDGVAPVTPEVDPRWADLPRPLYGCVGALVGHKGHRHVVDAMVRVPGTLVIAGEGELRPALEAQVRARGLHGRVLLPGHVEAAGLYGAIDVFVHPSEEEGMGQVVVEAMAAGCRVVATRAGGVPEVVGEAGLLVPVRDSGALAAAMVEALGLPADAGVERARAFSVDAMASGTTAVYDGVSERVRRPRR